MPRIISRRRFCSAIAGAATAFASLPSLSFGRQAKTSTLRTIAYNLYGATGWPKKRPLAKRAVAEDQMEERIAFELALSDPHIVTFSESPDEAAVKEIAQSLGMDYVRFPSGLHWPGTLLSRFKIVDAVNAPVIDGERPEDLFTRHWGRAELRLDNGETLIVHSAHLHPSKSAIRQREIAAMLGSMRDDLEAERSMLLMGDLNHSPEPPEYPMWTKAGWVDTFAQVGEGKGLTIKADKPKWRIDYVMATGPIAGRIVESRPLFEGAFRTNPADPESFALSDHLPQLATFRDSR